MEFLVAVLKIAFGFALVIGIHELGHAIAAILCKVKVHRWSIGIGPGLVIKNVPRLNEIVISPFVIGGYVAIDEKELAEKSLWTKFFVSISGMLANVLLAIVLLVLYGASVLKAIFFSFYIWLAGWYLTLDVLLSGKVPVQDAVSGPIGIGQMMVSDQFGYLFMLALLNLAIAMFNLLPLLPLDGGRILLVFLEKFLGREKAEKMSRPLAAVGFMLLIMLLVFATTNDLFKLFG